MPPALPADPTRIRLASTVEVNYWCQTLNCTVEADCATPCSPSGPWPQMCVLT